MAKAKVLIADDDPIVHESLGVYLKAEDFDIVDVYDGEAALEAAVADNVSMCVLDIMMPKKSGIEVCKDIRKNLQVPIIMLSAKGDESDRLIGLELGADDYIVKPFSPREVVARIKVVLRRSAEREPAGTRAVSVGGLVIDINRYSVTLLGQPIICTPKELEILYTLASNPSQVFTREQLLTRIWGYEFAGETRTVDTHIKRIRSKLEHPEFSWAIKTIYGVGYKFEQL